MFKTFDVLRAVAVPVKFQSRGPAVALEPLADIKPDISDWC